jgi:hypothetical protein
MRLTETVFSRGITIKTDDPYKLALDIMKRMSDFVKVIEKKNTYMTDGPRHMSEVIFDAVHEIDEHTILKLSFNLLGGENGLNIDIQGVISVNIIKYGPFSDMFSDYYIKNVYPALKKNSESQTNRLIKQVNKVLDTL